MAFISQRDMDCRFSVKSDPLFGSFTQNFFKNILPYCYYICSSGDLVRQTHKQSLLENRLITTYWNSRSWGGNQVGWGGTYSMETCFQHYKTSSTMDNPRDIQALQTINNMEKIHRNGSAGKWLHLGATTVHYQRWGRWESLVSILCCTWS